MAIKRYLANADTTITNAFKNDLSTRATGSNMGESDVLEIFSIYGQSTTSSVEKARALVNFPVTSINTDRTNGDIPESGSVKFFLKLFNCPHSETLPKNFDMQILPISRSWNEGSGLDMEEYKDEDVSNWVLASNTLQPNITDVKFITTTKADLKNEYFSIYSAENKRFNFVFQTDSDATTAALPGVEVVVPFTGSVTTVRQMARILSASIRTYETGLSASISLEDTDDATGATVRITTTGSAGVSGSFQGNISTSHLTVTTVQHGGRARWTNQGGDFHEVGYTAGKNLPHYKKSFQNGTENLEVNITALVEEWIKAESTVDPDRENYGVMLKMSGSYEDGGFNRSYYTKKFFARGSEYFYKRPVIEARWDDSILDDRGNFHLSSSLVSGEDNLNRLYLYNIVGGRLKNIPTLRLKVGQDPNFGEAQHFNTKIFVQVFPSGNVKNERLKPKSLPIGGGVTVNNATTITGSWVSTGIYSASFAYTGSEKQIFDVWSIDPGANQLVTSSAFSVKTFTSYDHNPSRGYVTSISNLKDSYSQADKTRFRVFIRERDQQPNIYNVATNVATPSIVEEGYYRVYRMIDELEVIPFGTGSTGQQTKYTRLSYDKKGNYFDLDMSLFESGYSYAIQLAYDVDGRHIVQDKVFKFRVEK